MERRELDGGQGAERRKFTMKSLLERSGRGADGVVDETGPVRPSLMIKALIKALIKATLPGSSGEGAGRLHVSVLGSEGGPNTPSTHPCIWSRRCWRRSLWDSCRRSCRRCWCTLLRHTRLGWCCTRRCLEHTAEHTCHGFARLLPPVAFQWLLPPWV